MARLGRSQPFAAHTRAPAVIGHQIAIAGVLSSGPSLAATFTESHSVSLVLSSSPGLTTILTDKHSLAGTLSSSPGITSTLAEGHPLTLTLGSSPAITTAAPAITNHLAGTLGSSPAITFTLGHALPVLPLAAAPNITTSLAHVVPVAGTLSDSPGLAATLSGSGAGLSGTLGSSPGINATVVGGHPLAGTTTSGAAIALSVLHSVPTGGVLAGNAALTSVVSQTFTGTLSSSPGLRAQLQTARHLASNLHSSASIQTIFSSSGSNLDLFVIPTSRHVGIRQAHRHTHIKVPR